MAWQEAGRADQRAQADNDANKETEIDEKKTTTQHKLFRMHPPAGCTIFSCAAASAGAGGPFSKEKNESNADERENKTKQKNDSNADEQRGNENENEREKKGTQTYPYEKVKMYKKYPTVFGTVHT